MKTIFYYLRNINKNFFNIVNKNYNKKDYLLNILFLKKKKNIYIRLFLKKKKIIILIIT